MGLQTVRGINTECPRLQKPLHQNTMTPTMSKAALVAAFAGCASAFTAPMHGLKRMDTQRSSTLFLSPTMQTKSVVGDNSMVGDKGFDPLGFANSVEKLNIYREAELKHGRLAMLAALGWPVSEALDKPIADYFGLKTILVAGGPEALLRAPSLLNGGLDNVSPLFWAGVFAFSAVTEVYATKIKKRAGFRNTLAALGAESLTGIDIDGDGQVGAPTMLKADNNYLAGDLGFDPLGLFKGSDMDKRTMQLKELNNGRLAMIAITGYAINEAATKLPVLKYAFVSP
jgi:hypothetical protein